MIATESPAPLIPPRPTFRSHPGINPKDRDESCLLDLTPEQEHRAAAGVLQALYAAGYRGSEVRSILLVAVHRNQYTAN